MTSPIPLKYLKMKHIEKRPREYLFEHEVEKLIDAAKLGSNSVRDQTLLLMCFRHALRPGEACALTWSQIDFDTYKLHVVRQKNGENSVHPMKDREVRLLRRLWKEREEKGGNSPYVFMTREGNQFNSAIFLKLMTKLGKLSGLLLPIHPHMLRHSTGYHLANQGVDTRTIQYYFGHKNINNTVLYTKLSSRAFDKLPI